MTVAGAANLSLFAFVVIARIWHTLPISAEFVVFAVLRCIATGLFALAIDADLLSFATILAVAFLVNLTLGLWLTRARFGAQHRTSRAGNRAWIKALTSPTDSALFARIFRATLSHARSVATGLTCGTLHACTRIRYTLPINTNRSRRTTGTGINAFSVLTELVGRTLFVEACVVCAPSIEAALPRRTGWALWLNALAIDANL